MVSGDTIIWTIAIGAVAVSFLNPAGLLIGLAFAAVVLGARYGLPFLGDVYRARQSGVSSAKYQQRAREQLRREKK